MYSIHLASDIIRGLNGIGGKHGSQSTKIRCNNSSCVLSQWCSLLERNQSLVIHQRDLWHPCIQHVSLLHLSVSALLYNTLLQYCKCHHLLSLGLNGTFCNNAKISAFHASLWQNPFSSIDVCVGDVMISVFPLPVAVLHSGFYN